MNLYTGQSSDLFFGGAVPPAVHELLHRAASAGADERTALLWTAQALEPTCLATYYVIYKHHAGRREFDLAERAAWRALQEAASQAGLPQDWRAVAPPLAAQIRQGGPGRFWLFTLKALAFIHLRSERPGAARELLRHLDRCDPEAGLGSEVIASLIDATTPRTGPRP